MASLRDRVKGHTTKQTGGPADPETFITAAGGDNPRPARPWETLEKKAVPRTTFNLRLNDYQLTLLRCLAEQHDESMQKLAKQLLIPALEQLAAERRLERS